MSTDTATGRDKLVFALAFLVAIVAMRCTGAIDNATFASLASADLWAYMLGVAAALLAQGWTAAKLTDVRQKAAQ
jgi:hypothetical protein